MKIFYTAIIIAVLLSSCARQEPSDNPAPEPDAASQAADLAKLTDEAKAAVKVLAGSLTSQLQAALQAGGPVEALDICHTTAPALTAAVSQEHGMSVARVSLKYRNPVIGTPTDWQTQVLHDFESRKMAGEDPQALAYSAIVGPEFRFMKAIPTAGVCLNCHGSQLQPDLVARLTELYPDDRAVGFSEGDLRGAFVVTRRAMR